MTDPDYQAALRVASLVIYALVVSMLIAAVVLGVRSIVGAWPRGGRPGRTAAIVLGSIGIAISALMSWVIVMPYV